MAVSFERWVAAGRSSPSAASAGVAVAPVSVRTSAAIPQTIRPGSGPTGLIPSRRFIRWSFLPYRRQLDGVLAEAAADIHDSPIREVATRYPHNLSADRPTPHTRMTERHGPAMRTGTPRAPTGPAR
ncbi:hypothetical protein ABZ753_01490 [Streptomyces griseoincarnatus]